MSYRYVITNGCSCTRGEELANSSDEAWPSVLASLLGAQAINLARDGSSNRRIVRSTVERLPLLLAELQAPPGDVLVILCWTESSRHEYFSEAESPERRNGTSEDSLDANWQRIGIWRDRKGHRPTRAFYRHMWSDTGQAVNFCVDWVTIDAYLRGLGVDARYAFAFPPIDFTSPALRQFESQLPRGRVLGTSDQVTPPDFITLVDHLPKGSGGHPLTAGHRWFAEAVFGWLEA